METLGFSVFFGCCYLFFCSLFEFFIIQYASLKIHLLKKQVLAFFFWINFFLLDFKHCKINIRLTRRCPFNFYNLNLRSRFFTKTRFKFWFNFVRIAKWICGKIPPNYERDCFFSVFAILFAGIIFSGFYIVVRNFFFFEKCALFK